MKMKGFLLLGIIVCLISCEPNTTKPLVWKFENGRVKLIAEGTQDSWADPWKPIISIYLDGSLISTQPGLPVFVSEFSKENIQVEWEKEEHGRIIFTQRDGEEKQLILPRLSSLLE